jgi:hypothetical protein
MEGNRMLDLERDLEVAGAITEDLKQYLLSDLLYWQLSAHEAGSQTLPQGTLGGLLLRLHRLGALADLLSAEQVQHLEAVSKSADGEIAHWRVQAEEKALREVKARLHSWHMFLEECQSNPGIFQSEYPVQAEGRTAIALLLDFLGDSVDGQALLAPLEAADHLLKTMSVDGDFVWDGAMEPAFPKSHYWWLYVRLMQRG